MGIPAPRVSARLALAAMMGCANIFWHAPVMAAVGVLMRVQPGRKTGG